MIHIHRLERYWMITIGIVMGGFVHCARTTTHLRFPLPTSTVLHYR
jgi:hypothetical protein